MMRIAPRAVLLFVAMATEPAGVAAATAQATTKVFSGWTATCDNLRDCVAISGNDDGDGLFYVRVARGASNDSAPVVKVVLAAPDPIPGGPATLELAIGSGAALRRFTLPVKKIDPDGAAVAGEPSDPAFLAGLVAGGAVDYAMGALKGKLVLAGLPAALRFIDERQGRLGTSTALVARGMTPTNQVPAPPSPPVVQPASFAASAVNSPRLDRALLDMAKPACDPEVVEAHTEAAAWAIGADRRLVAVPCVEGAYNLSVALFTTDGKGEQPRPAMLEQPPAQGDASADNVVVNYDFDAKSLTLSSLDKGRGLGDCGSARTWVWTGEIFALLRASELEACPGALPEDWPAIYSATRK